MMWLTYILCLSVVLTASTSSHAWLPFTKYRYQLRGRTLGALNEVDNVFVGIIIRAMLTIYPTPQQDVLYAKLTYAQYATIHAELPGGWAMHIPDDELKFRRLHLIYRPFRIRMVNGTVQELGIDDNISYSEAYIIFAFVNQMQVDVQGNNINKGRIIEALESGIMTYTQIDIFYKDSQFLALHRSELYGPTDFLANCGGLLGLFMGFSFLSLIEIVYFSAIRLWIKCRKRANVPS